MGSRGFSKFKTFALAVCLGLAMVAAVSACPTCKDSLAQTGNDANIMRGYFWSILFMMSMPFLILGGLGTYMYMEVRRARGRRELASPTSSAHQLLDAAN